MANTIVNTTILGGSAERIVYFTLVSDGTQETATVVYDADGAGLIPSLNTRIMDLHYSMSTVLGRARLVYDASTPLMAWSLAPSHSAHHDFHPVGGLKNGTVGAAGVTGDVTITTTGLAAGDSLSLVLHIKAS